MRSLTDEYIKGELDLADQEEGVNKCLYFHHALKKNHAF